MASPGAVYDSTDASGGNDTVWLFTYAATPSEQINNLIALVKSFGLPKGTANSLIVKLKNAAAAINANDSRRRL